MNRRYEEPPLEEAIFELFVRPAGPWTPTAAEQLAKSLPSYSGKRDDLEDINVLLGIGPGRSIAQGVEPGARRTRLWNLDQSRAVQFGVEMCTFNVRKPYGHFEDHLPAIRELFGAYLSATKPQRLGWVGQRYLNIVQLPVDAPPSNYFELFPRFPTGLPEPHRPFAVQVETARFAQGTTVVNLALLKLGAEAAVYTIDVYARSDDTVPLTVDDLLAWQQRAHESIRQSFELTITAAARRLFKEVPCSCGSHYS
ncbi:MAG: TIGR04255 family protein [Polyangiaceae bacterium]|nr:TIGR04255 family protein [Polyangiaceae bacterium]